MSRVLPIEQLRTIGFADVLIGGRLAALAYGCDCLAPVGDQCSCPDAVWFHRYERDEWEADQ